MNKTNTIDYAKIEDEGIILLLKKSLNGKVGLTHFRTIL